MRNPGCGTHSGILAAVAAAVLPAAAKAGLSIMPPGRQIALQRCIVIKEAKLLQVIHAMGISDERCTSWPKFHPSKGSLKSSKISHHG